MKKVLFVLITVFFVLFVSCSKDEAEKVDISEKTDSEFSTIAERKTQADLYNLSRQTEITDDIVNRNVMTSLEERSEILSASSDDYPIEDLLGTWVRTTEEGMYTAKETMIFNENGTYENYYTVSDGKKTENHESNGIFDYAFSTISFASFDKEGGIQPGSTAMVFIQKDVGVKRLFILFGDTFFSWFEMEYEGPSDPKLFPQGIYQSVNNWEFDRSTMMIIDIDNSNIATLSTSTVSSNEPYYSFDIRLEGDKVFYMKDEELCYYDLDIFRRENTEYLFAHNNEGSMFAWQTLETEENI